MSFFDSVFDQMSWSEICCRLPGEQAVAGIKRRITNLDTLRLFFDNVGIKTKKNETIKSHVNQIISGVSVDDLLATFTTDKHPLLFNWLDDVNLKRVKSEGVAKLDVKFLYNAANSKDEAEMVSVMDKVLKEPELDQAKVRSVLHKADDNCMAELIGMILADPRPEVRCCVLAITGMSNKSKVTDLQRMIGLKAYAKCQSEEPLPYIMVMDFNLFSSLRPLERVIALERYLKCFPLYQHREVFPTPPTEEEFQVILFAGCMSETDRVTNIMKLYNQITKEDEPEEEEE